MTIAQATDQHQWDTFLKEQRFSPFLQSWTMGEVYRQCGQEPIRLEIQDGETLIGICQAIVVKAKRGWHLSVPYGPVGELGAFSLELGASLVDTLKRIAKEHSCSFVRMSPFAPKEEPLEISGSLSSPLHLLAEHIWHLPLIENHPWTSAHPQPPIPYPQDKILMSMRKTTRNLIRRAEREGVTIEKSRNPMQDIEHFLRLHEITRKRHKFTPYTDDFFRVQLEMFSKRDEATLYLAYYQGDVIASSIHMHVGSETSYHHGASSLSHPKIPASYLLQWTAVTDAIERGDHTYNFWGIAPVRSVNDKLHIANNKHPFAGVTTFKMGFGGELLELQHCRDIPVNGKYYMTRAIETVRKWKRGF